MLTQGSAPDPKCKLNITFLTLPHPLHCLICGKDIMIIVLLLPVMGDGKFGGWLIDVKVWAGGERVGCHTFSIFCSVFVLLLIVLSWLEHDSCVCFIVPCLLSLSLVLLIRHY